MDLPRIGKARLSDRVIERLVGMIERGEVLPGEKLPSEHELTVQFCVGRSSVREALRALALAGMVEARPRHGTFVTSALPSTLTRHFAQSVAHWAVRDLYQIRMLLEGQAAELAAAAATPAQIAAMSAAHGRIAERLSKGASYFRANNEFHLAIARGSRNGALVQCIAGLIGGYRELREQINLLESVPQQDLDDHAAILAAIRARNGARAGRLMRQHLEHTIARLEAPHMALAGRPLVRRLR